ncbi:hypothetical protein AB0J74_22915 [Asanoa sp. NPDC049573]|uniref:hypothetical protein n=1 Tax=Asanoa sp. NPDC049573 TaxID=3155396 RepID=UPI00344AF7CC
MSFGDVVELGSTLAVGMGVVVTAAVLAATRRPLAALAALLDFLVAAGLLHLAADPTYLRALSAGIVLAIRHLISWTLRTDSQVLARPRDP